MFFDSQVVQGTPKSQDVNFTCKRHLEDVLNVLCMFNVLSVTKGRAGPPYPKLIIQNCHKF